MNRVQAIVDQLEQNTLNSNTRNLQGLQNMRDELTKYTNSLSKVQAIERKLERIDTHVVNQLKNNQSTEGKTSENKTEIFNNKNRIDTVTNDLEMKIDSVKHTLEASLMSTNDVVEEGAKISRDKQAATDQQIYRMRADLSRNEDKISSFNAKMSIIEKELNIA